MQTDNEKYNETVQPNTAFLNELKTKLPEFFTKHGSFDLDKFKDQLKDKNANERRIRYLDRMVRTAHVISDESADDEVGLNNTVTVVFEEDNEEETYRIVTAVRGNVLNGMISNISPMGKALLGHKVGDRVLVTPEKGDEYYVVIKSIINTVDDGNDEIR